MVWFVFETVAIRSAIDTVFGGLGFSFVLGLCFILGCEEGRKCVGGGEMVRSGWMDGGEEGDVHTFDVELYDVC